MAIDILGSLSFGSGTGGTVLTTILWALVGACIAGIMYMIYVISQWKIKVRIRKKNGFIEYDKAKVVKDGNDKSITKHVLKKNKGKWEGPIPDEYIGIKKTAFGMVEEVDLVQLPNGTFALYKPEFSINYADEATLKTSISPSLRKWGFLAFKDLKAKISKNDFWEKYGQTLMTTALIGMVLVTMVVMVNELGTVTEGLQSVASSLRATAQSANSQVINNATGVIS